MNINDLMGARHDIELLVDGVWYTASVREAHRHSGDFHFLQDVSGFAVIAYWREKGSHPVEDVKLDAKDIPTRVRRAIKNRVLTADEVEHIQRIGRDEANRRTVIGLNEFDALCRTAKANVAPNGYTLEEAIKISREVWSDLGTKPRTAEQVIHGVKNLREHARKLADELNGPAGAREEMRAMRYKAATADKLTIERDTAIKSNLEKHHRILALEDELAKLSGAHRTFLEKEELRRRQEVLQADLERAREACKALREERDGAIKARDEAVKDRDNAVFQHHKVVDFHTNYVRDLAKVLSATSEDRFLNAPPLMATNSDVELAVKICRAAHDRHHQRMRRIAIALGMGEISNPAWPAHSDVERNIVEVPNLATRATAEIQRLRGELAAAQSKLAKIAEVAQ